MNGCIHGCINSALHAAVTSRHWNVCAEVSVNKTGRLLVSHEAPITSGFGAEVTATITKRCFARLESPPLRICGYDTPFPLVYEPVYMPTAQKIIDAVEHSLQY